MEALHRSCLQLLYIIRIEPLPTREVRKMWRMCGPSCAARGLTRSLAAGQVGHLLVQRSARAKTAGPGHQSPAPGFVPVDTPETLYD